MKNLKNMRRGFTMIELIFVIVIIGILAAIALPKLAATRDDAKISNIIANSRTLVSDMEAYYTAKGGDLWTAPATADLVTTVPGYTDDACTKGNVIGASDSIYNTIYFCDVESGDDCVKFDANATHLTVTPIAPGTNTVCLGVTDNPAFVGIAGTVANPKIYRLGGVGVVR